MLRRFFTTSCTNTYALKLKDQLNLAVQRNKKPVDFAKLNKIRQKKLNEKNMRKVTRVSAKAIVEKELKRTFAEDEKIGPDTHFSDEELDTLLRNKNIRLKYTILGTSGNQIKDSLLVQKDVEKFLVRNEIKKAIALARLARFQGVFAYGSIMKHLLNQGKLNSSLDLFNDIKKWGYQPDGRTLNILFSGFANYKDPSTGDSKISSNHAERLHFILSRALEKKQSNLSIIHINSAMKAFRQAKRPDLAIDTFNKISELKESSLMPDIRTYTELFSSLRIKNSDLEKSIAMADKVFERIQSNKFIEIDERLITAYSSVFFFTDDLRLKARALLIFRQWFRVCNLETMNDTIDIKKAHAWKLTPGSKTLPNDIDLEELLLPSDFVNKKKSKRFEPSDVIVKRYDSLCDLLGLKNDYLDPSDRKKNAGNEGTKTKPNSSKRNDKPSSSKTHAIDQQIEGATNFRIRNFV
ncbi:hypothetical protein CANARDRAFT_30071 [[Candida] arabinofermentans NRRL YB-2248]|uniref:Mitochondrial 15S rRNA processing factor CCM1 n=1 Tax=[Candida] arabinofermentans NRRL YB-2248 TaxID=983967 RepID=A0A1E4SUV0_9ASCO|nr:hypothetical protein CANARDRAFT_30071 [[Candida] arabinofermentans NRRL YB-2248]